VLLVANGVFEQAARRRREVINSVTRQFFLWLLLGLPLPEPFDYAVHSET